MMRNRLLRGLCLGLVAAAAGVVLQCIESARTGSADGGAPAADAAQDAGAAADEWFTLKYIRDDDPADKLLVDGSWGEVYVGHGFKGGKLVPILRGLSFGVFDESNQSLVNLELGFVARYTIMHAIARTGSYTKRPMTLALDELKWVPGEVSTKQYNSAAMKKLTITKLGFDRVEGSFDFMFEHAGGKDRRVVSGSFALKPRQQTSARLKP